MQREVDRQPDRFRIADRPNTEDERDRNHGAERNCCVCDPEDISKNRPRSKSHQNCGSVVNSDVGQEVSAFPHEEITAARALSGVIKVPLK